jgi:hypothetical protein
MKREVAKAQSAGELPGAGEERAGASDDVREQECVTFTEVAGGAIEKIMRGSGDHGDAEDQAEPPAKEWKRGGTLRYGDGCGAHGNGSEAGHDCWGPRGRGSSLCLWIRIRSGDCSADDVAMCAGSEREVKGLRE